MRRTTATIRTSPRPRKPPQPIEKGLPGPSLLAYVAVSKLADHLPLYRLESIFERQQVHVARSTMCAWMRCAGELVQPLVELMIARVKQSRVIHTDDTPVPIQSRRARSNAARAASGATWATNDIRTRCTTTRRAANATDRPSGWRVLQVICKRTPTAVTTASISQRGVTEVACWAHARRKFYDAQDSDAKRAAEMLALVGELYAIEREAKEQTLDEAAVLALRQQRSVPVLARIKAWLDAEGEVVLPRSPMAAAITYAQNQWQALCVYTTQGFLAIDNNASERALKRVAIGRKNWLFAGHDAAAENAARLWSLIASAERHGVDPQRYLTSVLAKLAQPAADGTRTIPARRLETRRRSGTARRRKINPTAVHGTDTTRQSIPTTPCTVYTPSKIPTARLRATPTTMQGTASDLPIRKVIRRRGSTTI